MGLVDGFVWLTLGVPSVSVGKVTVLLFLCVVGVSGSTVGVVFGFETLSSGRVDGLDFVRVCVSSTGCSISTVSVSVNRLISVSCIRLPSVRWLTSFLVSVAALLRFSVVKGSDPIATILFWSLLKFIVEVISLCSELSLVLLCGMSAAALLVLVRVALPISMVMASCCAVLGRWMTLWAIPSILQPRCRWALESVSPSRLVFVRPVLGRPEVVAIVFLLSPADRLDALLPLRETSVCLSGLKCRLAARLALAIRLRPSLMTVPFGLIRGLRTCLMPCPTLVVWLVVVVLPLADIMLWVSLTIPMWLVLTFGMFDVTRNRSDCVRCVLSVALLAMIAIDVDFVLSCWHLWSGGMVTRMCVDSTRGMVRTAWVSLFLPVC